MDIHKGNNIDFELLAKYLSGESTPEEAIEVDDWISYSANNRRLFVEASHAWQSIAENVSQQVNRPASLHKINIYRVGIAASLMVLFGALWLIVRSPRKEHSGTITSGAVSYITKRAGKEILRDTLPDHSIIVQNVNSVLQYTSDFNATGRELHLAGEAWFDVTANPAKPFQINIGKIRVIILGTSFNVQQSSSRIEVSVKTGSVMMLNDLDSLIVKTGQKGIYDIKENRFILMNSFNFNDLGYATRKLSFENITLKEIAEQIEKAYGVAVVFRNEKLKYLTMSSSFDNNSLTYIFDVISVTLHVNYKINNNVVYISSSQ